MIKVRCPKCGRRLADTNGNGVIVIKNGNEVTKIIGAQAVLITCDRCGHVSDVEGAVAKKTGGL